jgi:hypothetical protein
MFGKVHSIIQQILANVPTSRIDQIENYFIQQPAVSLKVMQLQKISMYTVFG